jgi:hypothetical protein
MHFIYQSTPFIYQLKTLFIVKESVDTVHTFNLVVYMC